MGFLSGALGSAIGAVGGLFGSSMDAKNDQKLANMNAGFQREVYQNQYQWKAADAKKAGLHPLAVVGGGSYSASPISSGGSTSYSAALGKLGEGIGDGVAAYMTKDEMAAEAAKRDKQADEQHDMNIRESASRIYMNNANALEATRRAASYSRPMASGLEIMPGQTDSDDIRKVGKHMDTINKYVWPINPDGSKGDPLPSENLSEAYENAPGIFAYTPYIDAMYDKWRAILSGSPIDGHYHDWRNNTWTRKKPPRNPLRFWD